MDIDVNELFKIVVENGGSDLHLRYDLQPKMRKDGRLVFLPGYEDTIFDADTVSDLCFRTMEPAFVSDDSNVSADRDENTYGKFVHNKYGLNYAYEAHYEGESWGRWRISVYVSRKKEGMVARLLQDTPLTFSDLDVHPSIPGILNNTKGMIFVTGETGSGKSTLMGAMVDHVNETQPVNIISLEDPIEMIHEPKMATVIQRDVGLGIDESSFSSALANALRQDPDIILIGEIRDIETMRTAFEAANTGHLVITTLHTSSASETVNRILKMYPAEEREGVAFDLSKALVGIISQQLLPSSAGSGRVAVNEILVATQRVRSVIANHAGNAELLHSLVSSGDRGSTSFEQHMLEKLQSGAVNFDDVYRASTDKEYFDRVKEIYDREGTYEEVPVMPLSIGAQALMDGTLPAGMSATPAAPAYELAPEQPPAAPKTVLPTSALKAVEERPEAPQEGLTTEVEELPGPQFERELAEEDKPEGDTSSNLLPVRPTPKGLPIAPLPKKSAGLPLKPVTSPPVVESEEEDEETYDEDSLSPLGEPVSSYSVLYHNEPIEFPSEEEPDFDLVGRKPLTVKFPRTEKP